MPSIEMVRMVSSGTEASMSAIRLARGFTGRDVIVKFAGCYHGHVDSLLVSAGSSATTLGVPNSPGVPKGCTADTLVLRYNDVAGSAAKPFRSRATKIAGVILEPVVGNMGLVVPSTEFLQELRRLTQHHGALLIYDEVMTGFRLALGGAQELFRAEARSDRAGQDRRRRSAGRSVRRPARHHDEGPARRPRFPGRHAVRQPAGHGGGPGHPARAARSAPLCPPRHADQAADRRPGRRRPGGRRSLPARPGRQHVDAVLHCRAGDRLRLRQEVRHGPFRPLFLGHARARHLSAVQPVRGGVRVHRPHRTGHLATIAAAKVALEGEKRGR